jgi:hypothetical protein
MLQYDRLAYGAYLGGPMLREFSGLFLSASARKTP